MKPHRLWLCTTLMVLFWAATVLAQAKSEQLGQVHFPVSCGADTQIKFDRAVALLHSFWYSEGVKAFTAVTEADPKCAMGYWGIAMSHWYPLWQPPSEAMLKKGWEAVERAKALGAKTEREREYIAAIESFYKDAQQLSHRTRALAYEKAMERLSARYPEDREAAVFYALALNATILPTDKTYANQLKAAEILERVFAEQPTHPGVAHYLIHAAAAWLARAEGKPEEAVRLMRDAAALEDATEKHPVTPGPIFPARELLGELLLELEQPAPALQEVEAALPREPNRFNGLYGAARAAELAGEVEKARTYYGKLVTLSQGSDTDRPALQQAKAFLAKK